MNSSVFAPASTVVLAGGQSRRLGRDKRQLQLWGPGGPTLLAHTVAVVGALCADVVVVLNDPAAWPTLSARLVGDRFPDGGPLGGIFSGLAAAREPYALVVACDMPMLSLPLLTAMLARPRTYDVLVPRSLRKGVARSGLDLEPLHAVYGKSCLGPMGEALAAGRRQVASFFAEVQVTYLEPDEIRRYDPAGHSFVNINTLEHLADAQLILAARRT